MRNAIYLCPFLLCACGGGGGDDDSSQPVGRTFFVLPAISIPSDAPDSGYYAGTTFVGPDDFDWVDTEAILTPGGEIRVHFSNNDWSGTGAFSFVGSIDTANPFVWSPGVLIGETCRQPSPGWGCDGAVQAEIRMTFLLRSVMSAQIRWQAPGASGFTYQSFDLRWSTSTYVDIPASLADAQGTYQEKLAGFAMDGDVVATIDATGDLFFQSPGTGCVGTGNLTPVGDGSLNAYSVALVIENCGAGFEYLNTTLEGLATHSVGKSSWGNWMIFWLSSSAGAATDVALTMWGARM